MKQLDHILLATDYGYSAEVAHEHAINLAVHFNADLSIINVLEERSWFTTASVSSLSLKLLQQIKKTAESAGVTVHNVMQSHGVPAQVISASAAVLDVDLVVIGVGGGLDNELEMLGGTAERLVRYLDKPLWIARRGTRWPLKSIVCAVDFSSTSARALRNATRLAREFKAHLYIVTIAEEPPFYLSMTRKTKEDEQRRLMEEHIAKRNAFMVGLVDLSDVSWEQQARPGVPSKMIPQLMKTFHADILVMGLVGEHAGEGIQVGRTALKILRTAPSSVLGVKHDDALAVKVELILDDVISCVTRARQLMDAGHADNALPLLTRCLERAPLSVKVLELTAEACRRLGRAEESARYSVRARAALSAFEDDRAEAEIRKELKVRARVMRSR